MALNSQSFSVPFRLNAAIESALERWRSRDGLARLWQRDASLWTGSDEAGWLGWLEAPAQVVTAGYQSLATEIRSAGFSDVLLLGMGGSVLCPALFGQVFGAQPGFPTLRVLDSLDPVDIAAAERSIDLERALVVVSSKSGSTLETRLLTSYFVERIVQTVGKSQAGRHLVAITDPGSALEQSARELGFRHVFEGRADIGGRFSAFSSFGLVPLALLGVDVGRFVAETMPMVEACGPRQSVLGSPGVLLGVIMGVLAHNGHNKVTFIGSPSSRGLADWLEQLLAESTGKAGVGLIPVTGEGLRAPEAYGTDRLFIHLDTDVAFPGDGRGPDVDEACIAALEESGHPVVRIRIRDAISIGQELFRWEMATAVAGSELGVHPFNQPDVEASKRVTRDLMAGYERSGRFEDEVPTTEDDTVRVFWSSGEAAGVSEPERCELADCVRSFVGSLAEPDYCAVLAYAPEDPVTQASLELLREALVGTTKATITLSRGPRYLHSSGQLHKGGPDNGAFLVLVARKADDIAVPGHPYSFGVVTAAQARGDSEILIDRGRRVLRIEVGGRFDLGIRRIVGALSDAG